MSTDARHASDRTDEAVTLIPPRRPTRPQRGITAAEPTFPPQVVPEQQGKAPMHLHNDTGDDPTDDQDAVVIPLPRRAPGDKLGNPRWTQG